MKNELVSIIIPTYKRSETLERAIISAENQSYKNIEIIIVDDNANYPEIRKKNKEIINKHDKIIFIENKKNLGGGLSRNVGIKEAKGNFIAFLDDDDEYLPTKIERQLELYKSINNNKAAIIYCYANMINVDGGMYIRKNDIEGCDLLANIKNCIAATSWWLCPKKPLIEVGGFEDIGSRQDASLIMKLMLKGYEVYRVPEVLLNYYWHNSKNGISSNDEKAISAEKQYFEIYKKYSMNEQVNAKLDKEIKYTFYYRIANLLARNSKRKEAGKYLKKMMKIHKVKKENVRILLSILFNKTIIKLSNIKNKTRYGES